jgi:hypothetical protein
MTINRIYSLLKSALFCLVAFSLVSAQPAVRKNLSVNKNDIIDSLWKLLPQKTYPHAQSNSECRGEPWFRARCAINDTVKNTGHGQGFPSWGPEEITHPWLLIDFGKQVVVDSVVIYIRADFPHDGYWYKGRLIFSDNTGVNITLDSTAKPQSFKIALHSTTFLRIDSLAWHVPTTWCAISQVQVFGYDNVSGVTSNSPVASVTKGNTWKAVRFNGLTYAAGMSSEGSDQRLFDLSGREMPGHFTHECFILRKRNAQEK